jgi:HTH-type transcriptional regulator/antitoxin HigA
MSWEDFGIVIAPGETIKEQIAIYGLTQKEFARRMQMSEKQASRLVNGEIELTNEIARKLTFVLGMHLEFWLGLERDYRIALMKQTENDELKKDFFIFDYLDYQELVRTRYVEKACDDFEKIKNLRSFLSITSLELLKDLKVKKSYLSEVSFADDKEFLANILWMQKAQKDSMINEYVGPLSISRLIKNFSNLKECSKLPLDKVVEKISSILLNCGVYLAYLPKLKNSTLDSYCLRHIDYAVVAIADDKSDLLTFFERLFKELSFIVMNKLSIKNKDHEYRQRQTEIESFVDENLLSTGKLYQEFANNIVTDDKIKEIATNSFVDPSLVVTKLAKLNIISNRAFKELKK